MAARNGSNNFVKHNEIKDFYVVEFKEMLGRHI